MKSLHFWKTSMIGAILMLLAFSPEASAESSLGLKGIGPRLGYVDPDGGLDGTVEFGVVLEFGEIVRQLHWDASASFWSTGREYRYFNDKYDWSLSDFVLRSGVNYHFIEGDWEPFAGGGLGLHFYSWDYSGAPSYANSSDNELGFYIDGGVEHDFSDNVTGQLQLQFDFADPDQTALLFNLIFNLQ